MLRRFLSMTLVAILLVVTASISLATPIAPATVETPGQGFWGGLACGAALGAIIVGGGALAAGTGGLGAAMAISAGGHVLGICMMLD